MTIDTECIQFAAFFFFRSSSLAYWSKYQDKIRICYNENITWKVKKDDMPWQGKMTHVIEAVIADCRKPPSFYETKLLLWAQVRKWVMWLRSCINICTAVKTQSRCVLSPPGRTVCSSIASLKKEVPTRNWHVVGAEQFPSLSNERDYVTWIQVRSHSRGPKVTEQAEPLGTKQNLYKPRI